MYFKMAFQNVKRSIRDYLIYFLTLTFAVCTFYSFNSMDAQIIMFEMSKNQASYMELVNGLISMVSIFVSLILGGLIVYANNFLIKKRKKELGIYMSLGMGKGKVSKILLIETFLIGLMALASGLILGIIASQGLSSMVAHLFKFGMHEYKFVISIRSIGKSILYFSVIFMMVMCLNTWSISKYALIDLMNADRKNEELPNKSSLMIIGTFVISIICIGIAYVLGIKVGLNIEDSRFYVVLIAGVVGTFLFFYSALGFILLVMMRNPKLYLRKLNPFILRQMQYKVNTHFISMATICLMLFLTIGMLSSGLGFKAVIEKGIEEGTPYDATGMIYSDYTMTGGTPDIEQTLEAVDFNIEPEDKVVLFNTYIVSENGKEVLSQLVTTHTAQKIVEDLYDHMFITAVKYSDYQKLLALKGDKAEVLSDDQVLVISNMETISPVIEELCMSQNEIKIGEKDYTIANQKPISRQFDNSGFKDNRLMLVIPDEAAINLPVYSAQMNVIYGRDYESAELRYHKLFNDFRDGAFSDKEAEFIIGYTRNEIYESNMGMTGLILFIGIYMGLIFLLASAALLALQQLTEAGESKKRYEVLRKIGATQEAMRRTMFIQVLFYFMLPLVLSLIHAVVGMHIINKFLVNFGQPSSIGSGLVTGAILLLIYGGYFIATYSCYKETIME